MNPHQVPPLSHLESVRESFEVSEGVMEYSAPSSSSSPKLDTDIRDTQCPYQSVVLHYPALALTLASTAPDRGGAQQLMIGYNLYIS